MPVYVSRKLRAVELCAADTPSIAYWRITSHRTKHSLLLQSWKTRRNWFVCMAPNGNIRSLMNRALAHEPALGIHRQTALGDVSQLSQEGGSWAGGTSGSFVGCVHVVLLVIPHRMPRLVVQSFI